MRILRISSSWTLSGPMVQPPRLSTMGDHRQLGDALFHAGTGSGGHEFTDEANNLQFYILDVPGMKPACSPMPWAQDLSLTLAEANTGFG